MVSTYNLLFITALFFVMMQMNSSTIVDGSYSLLMEKDNNDEQEHHDNGYPEYLQQRSAHLQSPSASFKDLLNKNFGSQNFYSTKRESFGRKHHWDAFFGRR
ncbi:unnamed protein product [Rotaria magnacalcarata]|uniref:Uncharacterized protein n=3 Tax=Rotaria magnacalcarata TaxID=392030 RepID=A0A817A7Y8_9BILA|nr:unnamed protein product [Rotaria magnacalcarata]CAF1516267.1 unnamed protein product [Rotaria magnacalcarata]CAF2151707.1 unnamed protein product [Rotaria magnacalcarata]CAF2258554.1 unnamed protein product [Rotaria magnacalcarata]CAF3795916.1 unnamed protein product [Rotaria magnacalcarata]